MLVMDDLRRYKQTNPKYLIEEPSWIVVCLYRICRWIKCLNVPIMKAILNIIFFPWYVFFTILFGIHIPRGADIGPGIRIYHYGCIVINHNAIIGKNCTLRQGVTIGNKSKIDDVPVLGDNVDIGAGAIIIGEIFVGNNVSIGANAVVITNVPDNCIAVGVPARIMKKKDVP